MTPALNTLLRAREPEPGLLNLPAPIPSSSRGWRPGVYTYTHSTPSPPQSSPPQSSPPQSSPPQSSPPQSSPPSPASQQPPPQQPPSQQPSPQQPAPQQPPPQQPPASQSLQPPSSSSTNSGGTTAPPNSAGEPEQSGNTGVGSPSQNSAGNQSAGSSGNVSQPGGNFSSSSGPPEAVNPGDPAGEQSLPLNNVEGPPSNSVVSSNVVGASTPSMEATKATNLPPTLAGASGLSYVTSSGSDVNGSSGIGPTPGTTSINKTSSGGPKSHISAGALGGIIAVVVIGCLSLAFLVLRKRYQRRKAERQVEWLSGFVSDPDMQQRVRSMRSSWGTPVNHGSVPFRNSTGSSELSGEWEIASNTVSYDFGRSDSGAPVLPMPVHSPAGDRSFSQEDPFSDFSPSPQPLRTMESLPIRFSLISSGSLEGDPFDDAHAYTDSSHNHDSKSPVSAMTFGHNASPIMSASGTQGHFPMPPTTPVSSSSLLDANSPTGLQAPRMQITFPDSPVSPVFAASGSSSYPRRAYVKIQFQPSQERSDEIRLNLGDHVTVISVYEDGWGFVQQMENHDRGLVPLMCLEIDNP
ncbi:hypothetical protein K439DRAFT_1613170 [Ramaria rubella]|nr:hypothetical protein K439DRAFT_1613170 [Ramaria rubella]